MNLVSIFTLFLVCAHCWNRDGSDGRDKSYLKNRDSLQLAARKNLARSKRVLSVLCNSQTCMKCQKLIYQAEYDEPKSTAEDVCSILLDTADCCAITMRSYSL